MELFWFAYDIPRFESKTSHLTMLQEGAYHRLMRHYYKTCAPIPVNQQQIVILAKAFSTDEIEAVSYVLKSFFTLESDGWHQATCDEEIAKARQINKKRKISGKAGGLAKARNLLQQKASKGLDNNSNNNKELKTKAASAFVTPDWLPQEEWLAFEEMRRKIRKPMTDKARSLIVTKLHKLRSHGHAPKQVLEQSIRNCWQDVFELKGESHGTNRGNNQASRQHVTAQHQRLAGNVLAVGAKYGLRPTSALAAAAGSAGVGNSDHSDGSRQTPRLAGDHPGIVEGEVKPIS